MPLVAVTAEVLWSEIAESALNEPGIGSPNRLRLFMYLCNLPKLGARELS